MTHHRKAATVLAAGILAATAATGAAATASAAEPSPAAPSVSASCSWRTNVGFYCGYDTRNVYSDYGDSGRQVKEIQALLRFRGIGIGPDGIDGKFGKDTRSAVQKFQRSWHLNDDGIVGPNTWSYLRTGV
ncbi:peptidoglycan-binding domain-containing protein [Streptomyces kanamyceticus]|uniref:Peptidoglycan-binding protein n=1 Tax=Streptomyces kanamyceticus TaxID=1967 RepID=A0A5J6GE38_STRKN|nr:peptidoglycan-binding domain-containing protein [Streptomyces kanamyceticus]QEU92258.1 peptidoglycan-binding protein [Streptomyces kanamyceticus]